MNLTVKRCLVGLVASATMFGIARAQDESAGTVQLGQQLTSPVPAPTDAQVQVPVQPGVSSPMGSAVFPPAPAPGVVTLGQPAPMVRPNGPAYGNYFPLTTIDQIMTPRYFIDSRGGGLYGYNAGYANIGAFVPYKLEDNAILFGSAQGLITYDGRGGGTVGTGWRYYMEDMDRIAGLSAWFDFDNGHVRPYQQLGLSFESLGRYIDYRVNGYLPVSNPDHVLQSNLTNAAVLMGNTIGLLRNNVVEQAFGGFDAEMGGPVPILGRYGLNAYIGGYQFNGMGVHGGSTTGVSGRILSQINEDVSFGVQATNDHLFGLNTQFQVFVNLPNGKSSRWLRNLRVRDRLVQNTFRQNRVIAKTQQFESFDVAINPDTHKAFFVENINPNLGVNGNGTAEHPFNSIAAYEAVPLATRQQVDIILVQPRNDATTTNLDTAPTLELFGGQRLLATSIAHTFTTANLPGQTLILPGRAGSLPPMLFNSTGGDVITMVGGNTRGIEVSGFEIIGSATGNGIVGNNVVGANINNNNIHSGLNGVSLTNLSGTFAAGTEAMFVSNNIHDNVGDGVQILNNGSPPFVPPLEVAVQNNTFNANGGDGMRLSAQAGASIGGIIGGTNTAATATTPAIVNANVFSSNGKNGLELDANGGTLNFMTLAAAPLTIPTFGIVNNTFLTNTNDGLHISTTNNSVGSFDIIANTFGSATNAVSGNGGFGINLVSDSGANLINIGGSTAAFGNSFFGDTMGAIAFNLTGTNLTTTNIQNNTILINGAAGGSVIVPGFNQNTLPANDDLSTGLVPIGFNANFFGVNFNQLFVNNNGNVTLTQPLATFTPFPIVNNGLPMIAPFFADVDTRSGNVVTYGTGAVNGHLAFGVNWPDVRHFSALNGGGLPTNNFQLVLIDRSDIAPGDFDFEFNYKQIQWEAGQASGSDAQGLGGSSARVGYTNGVNNSFELPGSAVNGALLDSGPAATSLIHNSLNSNVLGRYVFEVRNGVVSTGTIGSQNGIEINVSDNAHLANSNISNNSAQGLTGFALQVNTHGNGIVDNLNVSNNNFSLNGGSIQLNRADSSTLQVALSNNLMNQNTFNGLEVHASGTNVNGVIVNMADQSMNNNNGEGILVDATDAAVVTVNSSRLSVDSNRGDNIAVTAGGTSVLNLNLNNTISTNSGANGLTATTNGSSTLNLLVDSPADPLFTAATQSKFSNNTQNGIKLTSNGVSLMHANIFNTQVQKNGLDGVSENRTGASLVLSNIVNSSLSLNTRHGFFFQGLGSDPVDPTQPLVGTPNRVNLINDSLNNNGTSTATTKTGDGAHVDLFGQSVLVLNAQGSTFDANNANGLGVTLSPGAQFGYGLGNQRSEFDNVSLSGNGVNGVFINSVISQNPLGDAQSRTFFQVDSNQGNSVIANNAQNGILLQYTGGTHDVLISGDSNPAAPNFATAIQGNVADGIQAQVGAFATTTLTVDNVLIGGTTATTRNGGNGINFQDTSRFTVVDSSTGTQKLWTFNTAGVATLNVNNSTIVNNGLNGINMIGDALDGFNTQPDANGNPTPFQNNPVDPFGLLNANITNSSIINNTLDGVHIQMLGRMGGDHFGFFFAPTFNNLVFTNNIISNNGHNGVFYEGNAGAQLRPDGFGQLFREAKFINGPTTPATIALNVLNFEAQGGVGAWNTGRNAPILDSGNMSDWMNLSTLQSTNLVMYGNTIQFNGTQPNITLGDGVHIRVGTDSYLSADIGGAVGSAGTGNRISGNVHTDVYFESFNAYNPATNVPLIPGAATNTVSVNSASLTTLSTVFLDDTAQLDLRFNNNTGNSVTVVSPFNANFANGAVSPNGALLPFDPIKDRFGGNSGVPRLVQLFQVDNGNNLNTTNSFISAGNAEDLSNAFFNADWHTRGVADPLFPNPAFPQDFFTSPNNPFLP